MSAEIYREERSTTASPTLMRRISWGAVFAGLIIALVIQLTLSLLGIAIGAATIEPLKEDQPAQGLGIGAAIWFLISGLIALFTAGYVAGRLSGATRKVDGMLHGVVTWGTATLVTLFLLSTAIGGLISGLGGMLGSTVNAVGSGRAQGGMQEFGMDTNWIQQQVRSISQSLLAPTGRTEDQSGLSQAAQDPELSGALLRYFHQENDQSRQAVVTVLTTKYQMSAAQAEQQLAQWQQEYQQTKAQTEQRAREMGAAAAQNISKGALWSFIALIVGAAAAAWGGTIGAPLRRTFVETQTVAA